MSCDLFGLKEIHNKMKVGSTIIYQRPKAHSNNIRQIRSILTTEYTDKIVHACCCIFKRLYLYDS